VPAEPSLVPTTRLMSALLLLFTPIVRTTGSTD
jgi:hypothetical protein